MDLILLIKEQRGEIWLTKKKLCMSSQIHGFQCQQHARKQRTTIAEQGKMRNSVQGGKMAGLLCR